MPKLWYLGRENERVGRGREGIGVEEYFFKGREERVIHIGY